MEFVFVEVRDDVTFIYILNKRSSFLLVGTRVF